MMMMRTLQVPGRSENKRMLFSPGDIVEEKVVSNGRKYYFFNYPLQAESIKVTKIHMPHYKEALEKDMTEEMALELKGLALGRGNAIISYMGLQGSGKSYSAMFVAEMLSGYLGRKLTIGNVGFSLTEILSIAESAEIGSVVIMDEQTKMKGRGSLIEAALLENIERVVRQHKLFFFFLSPRYVSHSYRYLIEIWQPGSERKFDYTKTLEEQWKYTRCIIFNDKQIPVGYMITEAPSDMDFIAEYEKKKSEFIEGIRARQGSGRPKYLRGRAADFLGTEGRCGECDIDF